jgi:hypothetical protein
VVAEAAKGGVAEVPVVLVRGVRAHPLRPLALPSPLEVHPGHPSTTCGQGTSRCDPLRSRRGLLSSTPVGRHAHWCCSFRVILDSTHSAQPAPDLAWGVGSGCSGAIFHHHGVDTVGQHRVDRRLGCLLPYHPRCWYSLLCPTPTSLLSFYHGW